MVMTGRENITKKYRQAFDEIRAKRENRGEVLMNRERLVESHEREVHCEVWTEGCGDVLTRKYRLSKRNGLAKGDKRCGYG